MADATAPVQAGPTVYRFTDTDTAYDVTQSEERHHMGIRDGDILVVESEGVVGVLANNWPIALTEAHGQFHLAAERYNIRTMNDGRYAVSGDTAERVAAELGLPILPQHRAPVAAPADEAPVDVEDVWEPGHCTTMRGGAVHEVTSGLDGSDGGPVHIFPLCRTGAMTNQGTRYRKVKAPLTCKNCIGNRDRRSAAAAVTETPAAVEAPAAAVVDEAPAVSEVRSEAIRREAERLAANEAAAESARAVLLHAGHPEAALGRAGFRIRTNWLAVCLYEVDEHGEELTGHPLDDAFDALTATLEAQGWCIEYSKTGYHGSSLVLTAPLAAPAQTRTQAQEAEREALLTEIAARLSAGLVWSTAAAFRPVHDGEDGPVVGWTYRTRSGSEVRYAYVAARGLVLEGFNQLRRREDAARELLAHRAAGTDAADRTPPVATYLEAVAARSTEDLIAALHAFNVDVVKTTAEGPGRIIVQRGPDFMGTIFDAGSKSRRGRYEAWSPYAGTRNNLVGFYATVQEAVDGITHAWPVAAWELAEDTGAPLTDVLAAANLLADEEGVKVHLQIANATGADQKFYRDAAEILRARLTKQQGRAAYTRVQVENLGLSKAAALATHEGAHCFRPFHRPGEEQPAGWTFRVGFSAHARYGVTTPEGVAPIGLYEYATTAERAFHQAEKEVPAPAEPAPAGPADELDKRRARQLVAGTWPGARNFQERRAENGRLLGYTFQVGDLGSARYGWITAGGTFAQALEPYRSHAVDLLPVAERDERAARR